MKKLLLLVLAVICFAPCTQIAAMEHSTTQNIPNNQIWYTSSDGNVVTPNETYVFGATIKSNTYINGKGVITFDGDVTMIGEEAFYNRRSLTSVTIPDSVTTIGLAAFGRCNSLVQFNGKFVEDNGRILVVDGTLVAFAPAGLTRYIVPNSVTSIGERAFQNCSSLTSVNIPDSVTSIENSAFWYCTSLTSVTIPDSVTSIGNDAFYECYSLTSVNIPDSVTTIGEWAFYDCRSLKEFKGKFAADGGRCLIIDGVLNAFAIGCGVTQYTIPDSVTTIGDYAFAHCTSLTSVTIPDGVTSIGNYAFASCDSLTSVNIPDSVTTIGARAFAVCSLTSVNIPDSVTSIGYAAFAYCTSLTSVNIPDSLTTIGKGAFYKCYSLKYVYCKATTPPALGHDVFYDNGSGRKIYVPAKSVDAYKSASRWSVYASRIVGYDFENGVVVE